MAFLAWLALAAGVLLVYSARKGTSPGKTLGALLRGESPPAPDYPIEGLGEANTTVGAAVGSVLSQVIGAGVPGASGLIRPLPGRVTSPYGMRGGRMHYGIDIPASTGTPVRAAAAGKVIEEGRAGTAGLRVKIAHPNGWKTKYHHFSKSAVKKGDQVVQGQVIGYVGATGNASGPHLHFEVQVPPGSTNVNPDTVLPKA